MLTLLFVAMVAALAWGCALAWLGPVAHETPDPIGCWDEVQASLAITDLAGAECALAEAVRDRKRSIDRARRTGRPYSGPCLAYVQAWRAIRDEYRAAGGAS